MTNNAINNIASDLTVDNLNLDGNTISSLDGNGPIRLKPNTDGNVEVGDLTTDTSVLMQRTDPGKYLGMQDQNSNIGVYTSNGSPENVITADIGSLCTDITNGELYIKQTDSSATGWAHVGGGKGSLVQSVYGGTSDSFPFKGILRADTVPLITDGTELFATTITPRSINNDLTIRFSLQIGGDYGVGTLSAVLFQYGVNQGLAGSASRVTGLSWSIRIFNLNAIYHMKAGTTNEMTFSIRAGDTDGRYNWFLNAYDPHGNNPPSEDFIRLFDGKCHSSMVIHETIPF